MNKFGLRLGVEVTVGSKMFMNLLALLTNATFAPLMDDASVKPFHQNITTVLTRVWERRQKFEPTGQIE